MNSLQYIILGTPKHRELQTDNEKLRKLVPANEF